MSLIASTLRSFISLKIKTRQDSYTDQFSRLVIAKVFLVASIVMGFDWFHDNLACIPPAASEYDTNLLPDNFLQSGCWVRGFFIYPQLSNHMERCGYYGIPYQLREDGTYKYRGQEHTCPTKPINSIKSRPVIPSMCRKMDKYYFVHYQWMPFYVGSLAVMFYFPYIIYRMVNTDIISLRLNMKDEKVTPDQIVNIYFNHNFNSKWKMRMRLALNFLIKLLYVCVNLFAFLTSDYVLNYHFKTYGLDWIKWSRNSSSAMYDFFSREAPTPGNRMLPSFGMCELSNSRVSRTKEYSDHVVVICEISTNVLYQYVFLVLWFALVFSITISCLGVLVYVLSHVHVAFFIKNEKSAKYVYKLLTFRECEYLEFIRRRDLAMYGVIVDKLRELNDLPLPKARKGVKNRKASAPLLMNGNVHPHQLKHLDSVEIIT